MQRRLGDCTYHTSGMLDRAPPGRRLTFEDCGLFFKGDYASRALLALCGARSALTPGAADSQLRKFLWWPGTESNSKRVLIPRKLVNLRSARRAKKPALPGRRYKIGTKFISNRTIAQRQHKNTRRHSNAATRI